MRAEDARAGGSIINITSIEAHRAAPGFASTRAMKAAVANLTKTLALELGDRQIRVNCIAPDVIPTPGIGDVAGEDAAAVRRRTSTTSRPRRSISRPTGRASSPARRSTSTAATSRRADGAAADAGGYTTAGDAVDDAR